MFTQVSFASFPGALSVKSHHSGRLSEKGSADPSTFPFDIKSAKQASKLSGKLYIIGRRDARSCFNNGPDSLRLGISGLGHNRSFQAPRAATDNLLQHSKGREVMLWFIGQIRRHEIMDIDDLLPWSNARKNLIRTGPRRLTYAMAHWRTTVLEGLTTSSCK